MADLGKKVLDYVIKENFDGKVEELVEEIAMNAGFGGSPWYKHVPDNVREMGISWDYVIGDLYNDILLHRWTAVEVPYYEGTGEGVDVNDKYYGGYNKPQSDWTEEEYDMAWESFIDNDSSSYYIGLIAYLETEVMDYLYHEKSEELYEYLKTFINQEELDLIYEIPFGEDEDIVYYEYDNGETTLSLEISTNHYGDIVGDVWVNDIEDEVIYEGDFIHVDGLKKLFPEFQKYLK